MARFLFCVWPYTPHMGPILSIANALINSGNRVAFYSDERIRTLIENEDIQFLPFRLLRIEQADRVIFTHQKSGSTSNNPIQINAILHSWLLETIHQQIGDLDPYLSAWQPDVIVSDVTMWGPALILLEKRKIPVAIVGYTMGCMIPGKNVPPWGYGLPKPKNPRTRFTAKLIKTLTQIFLTKKAVRTANEIRRQHRLPPISEPIQHFLGGMPLYIIPSIPELDYDRTDLPPSVHYVGPCLWYGLDRTDVHLAKKGEGPNVCFVRDTVDDNLQKQIDASISEVKSISTHVRVIDNCQRRPEDFSSCRSISFQLSDGINNHDRHNVFDLVVTTAATNTVLASLRAGIPLLVIPKEWERPENAQRVVESGVGLRMSPRKCNPKSIRKTVNRILSDASYKENAVKIRSLFSQCRGPALAADLLDQLAADN